MDILQGDLEHRPQRQALQSRAHLFANVKPYDRAKQRETKPECLASGNLLTDLCEYQSDVDGLFGRHQTIIIVPVEFLESIAQLRPFTCRDTRHELLIF